MHRIGFIVPQGFQILSLAALTGFEVANLLPSGPRYQVELLSERGGPVPSSTGVAVYTAPFTGATYDTVVLGSLTEFDIPPASAAVVAFVRQAAMSSRRIASICSGAFVLAQAGLLDGRRATMHWAHADEFRRRFPNVRTEEDRIFINDGPIWTSAGMTAGLDLVLALIDSDLGAEAAKAAARLLVMHQRRMGGQKQHSALLDMTPKSDRIELVLAHIRENLQNELSVEELAEVANLSARQFSRTFLAETGQSPAKAVERIRLEAARFMMEEGRHSVKEVVEYTGFADRERMRRSFIRTFGVPPQALRRKARREPISAA
ncbi:GlxA family transcriptional regulator [Bradyrhizobium sp. WYCCWR 13023]|uniref:GlxA family transcriptional regulator n=1 Tax=Bradyrhizobium zhengyangense TaxID=2911009 RepID=A0A9X1R6H7_9BRAD|nr:MULTISPECIES: GlxA family transcriptional regulator [Bradyrhizobium]MCG2626276.1 GlxA family transcriptional regulator [Bradyrhizobium zhengyangense]MCG2644712.1 GlxA family transcriptional regulator [Bradyrhizobium zhengyangense]MCG2668284.1 GlxA family transcriptional regulator [Bradyrhizobium zhengyangense]MDA9521303.1 AraC family transcriptional regulator [Bradyrhizobium sp. CCBAU 11434]